MIILYRYFQGGETIKLSIVEFLSSFCTGIFKVVKP